MVRNAACRKMLVKLTSQTTFSSEQFTQLVSQLEVHCPSLVSFVRWIKGTFVELCDCPQSVKTLIRAVAASSPVCGFLRPIENLHVIVRKLINGVDLSHSPTEMKILQEECPIIFNALRDLPNKVLPNEWRDMFEELLRKCIAPFENTETQTSCHGSDSALENDRMELSFFPNLPPVRKRDFYLADAARRKEKICQKKHPEHSFFLPGIFTIFCPHGKPIDSPRMFFSNLLL